LEPRKSIDADARMRALLADFVVGTGELNLCARKNKYLEKKKAARMTPRRLVGIVLIQV
jgi:hypothetical protein